jgi:hypothetical protein
MTSSNLRERRRGRTLSNVLRLVLPLILLAPLTVLFAMVWQTAGDQAGVASLERHGVSYIEALGPLEIALTNAQSTAVNGGSANRGSLTGPVDAVSRVDERLGDELRTHDRWTELRTKIESLPASGSSTAVHAAYTDASDLLLALTDKIRNDSKLIRDPEADTYYLEDGAAQELPESVASAAQYTDLIIIAAGQPSGNQSSSLSGIATARSELSSNGSDVSEDVRLAVEGTGSRNLGPTLLSKLDRFNRALDALIPASSRQESRVTGADVSRVVQARDELQSAAADLSKTLLGQIDDALRSRQSGLSQRRAVAVVTLLVGIALALAPLALAMLGRRGERHHGTSRRRGQSGGQPGAGGQFGPGGHADADQPAHAAGSARAVEPDQWRPEPAVPQGARSDPQYAAWERFDVSQ